MNHYFCQMDFENENINFCLNSLNIYLKIIKRWIAVLPYIYIADNASTDESCAFVQQHYSAIKIIKNNNFGFAQGYNETLKHIDAEIY
jgi:GT2 family glycosyltransferase